MLRGIVGLKLGPPEYRQDKKKRKKKKKQGCWRDYTDAQWNAQCSIDVARAITYLGQAVVYAERQHACLNDDMAIQCRQPLGYAVTSLIWVGSFLANAAETCGKTLEGYAAACTQNIMRDMATGGSVIFGFEEDCFISNVSNADPDLHDLYRLAQKASESDQAARRLERRRRRRRWERVVAAAAEASAGDGLPRRTAAVADAEAERPVGGRAKGLALVKEESATPRPPDIGGNTSNFGPNFLAILQAESDAHEANEKVRLRTQRPWDLAMCAFDATNALSWLIRAGLKINAAAQCCPDPHRCAVQIVHIFAAFSFAAQFLSLALADCHVPDFTPKEQKTARCAADILDTIGSLAMTGISSVAAIDYCGEAIEHAQWEIDTKR